MRSFIASMLAGMIGGGIGAAAVRELKSPTPRDLDERIEAVERKVDAALQHDSLQDDRVREIRIDLDELRRR